MGISLFSSAMYWRWVTSADGQVYSFDVDSYLPLFQMRTLTEWFPNTDALSIHSMQLKVQNSWLWGALFQTEKTLSLFDTCLVSPLFLSPFSHAVFIYKTTTISHLPLCSPHVPQSCSSELCILFVPSFLSLPALLTYFLSSGYIFKTLEGTINTRCYKVSLWPLIKITSG